MLIPNHSEEEDKSIKIREGCAAAIERLSKDFTNKELTGALNAIGSAWSKFNAVPREMKGNRSDSTNKLRTVILQQVENQTITNTDGGIQKEKEEPVVHEAKVDDPNDF